MNWNPAAWDALSKGDFKNAVIAATPGGIEAQESDGQKEFVANETLPQECPREELEQLGFIFGENNDDIFIRVQFPIGWSKQPTDHSMWSDLIDNNGRKRGLIFYKAAFFDRSAHMRLHPRYSFTSERNDDYDIIAYIVTDCGKEIHRIDGYWKFRDASFHNNLAVEWLNRHFPDWESKLAYWD